MEKIITEGGEESNDPFLEGRFAALPPPLALCRETRPPQWLTFVIRHPSYPAGRAKPYVLLTKDKGQRTNDAKSPSIYSGDELT
ncbi:MAG TPA: hypothetical protein DEV81_00450 [Cyanobacteria bacterium UBA11049]|nr:hypothetical protein [Cyanobacteria bacterium UBA11049]